MKVNTILLMILVLIVVPLVVAQPTYQQNTIIDLTVPCTNNGSTCSGTATCEAMVINSDGLIIVNNESMTKNIGFFNYSIPLINTSILGDYEFTVCCKDAGQTKCKTLPFGVTPTGTLLSTPQGIIYILVLFGSIFIFLLTLYGAIKIPWADYKDELGWTIQINDLKYVKLFLWFSSYLILLWVMFIAKAMAESFLFMQFGGPLFNIIFQFMLVTTFPLFIGSMLFGIWYKLNDVKLQKALERGIPIR